MWFLQITWQQQSKPGISNRIHLPPSGFLKVKVLEEALQEINQSTLNFLLPPIFQHLVPTGAIIIEE